MCREAIGTVVKEGQVMCDHDDDVVHGQRRSRDKKLNRIKVF